MVWTLTTSGSVFVKTGLPEESIITHISGSLLEKQSDEAESIVCDIARSDVVGNYSTLTASGKEVLGNLAANIIAQKCIIQCKDEYAGQSEVELMLDVVENEKRMAVKLLEEDKVRKHIGIV